MESNYNVSSNTANIRQTSSIITFVNRWDHFLVRMGIKRNKHRIEPGLYALGNPAPESPVFVTANYTLSFDILRAVLKETDCYILVLDTKGVNVWCAAGKGTFGTDELVLRIEKTRLNEVVKHRKLIIPQLGAPGVAAHEVKERSGFGVEFGPVCAKDLPQYIKNHKATPEMRRVNFNFKDRLILIPVEVTQLLLVLLIVGGALFFIGGAKVAAASVISILAGTVLFPILLPWIPTADFSTKGFILGGLVALPFFLTSLLGNPQFEFWQRLGFSLAYLLAMPPVTAFLSLNFTGATTFTSRTGVKKEIFTYIPFMAVMFGGGIVLSITLTLINKFGG